MLSGYGSSSCQRLAGEEAANGDEPSEVRRFKREHMGARRNWDIPVDFPDWRVVTAYTKVTEPSGSFFDTIFSNVRMTILAISR